MLLLQWHIILYYFVIDDLSWRGWCRVCTTARSKHLPSCYPSIPACCVSPSCQVLMARRQSEHCTAVRCSGLKLVSRAAFTSWFPLFTLRSTRSTSHPASRTSLCCGSGRMAARCLESGWVMRSDSPLAGTENFRNWHNSAHKVSLANHILYTWNLWFRFTIQGDHLL